MTTTSANGTSASGVVTNGHAETVANGTIQASRIPRSSSSTLAEKKSTTQLRNDETISPVTRKREALISTRARRPLSRCLLPFPPPPSSSTTTTTTSTTSTSGPTSSSNTTTRKHQETYLILHPKDDKSERRVILVPPPAAAAIRVGRVVNPKTPAKLDNLLFDTKVLSRNHAEVFSDGFGRVYIRDLGSSNGTYINGFRLSIDGIPSEPFQLIVGQELALGIDIREETNQDNIAYHRVWFTVEHCGPMSAPPPETPTPSTLGAIDLDPWIPKPSTRDIVDHLVQEINAAKQIAEEITCVQSMLDGMMQGESGGDVVERVQRELEEKCRQVEELESLLGVEREERRQLEERIRVMEDERAMKILLEGVDDKVDEEDVEEDKPSEEQENNGMETTLKDLSTTQGSPITSLNIPVIEDVENPEECPTITNANHNDTTLSTSTIEEPATPPLSLSTAPSSPLQTSSRSISPISLPSTESSHHDPTHLLEKIASLEQQLQQANQEIANQKIQLANSSSILTTVLSPSTTSQHPLSDTGTTPVFHALTSSTDFPFTFSAPSTPRRRPTGSLRSPRKRTPSHQHTHPNTRVDSGADGDSGGLDGTNEGDVMWMSQGKGVDNNEFVDGLCAAVGVVVLGWMGMWFINHLVARGERIVR